MKKQWAMGVLLASVVLCLFIGRHLEAKIYGTISGQVKGEDTGKGIKGVLVRLVHTTSYGSERVAWKETKTDDEGRFVFSRVVPETYILEYKPEYPYVAYPEEEGYAKYQRYLDEIFNLKPGENRSVIKELKVGAEIRINIRIVGEDVREFGRGSFFDLVRLQGEEKKEINAIIRSQPELGQRIMTGIDDGAYVLIVDRDNIKNEQYPFNYGAIIKQFELGERERKTVDFEFDKNDPMLEIEPVDETGKRFDDGWIEIYKLENIGGEMLAVQVYGRFYDFDENSYGFDPIRPIVLKPGRYVVDVYGDFKENNEGLWKMDPKEIDVLPSTGSQKLQIRLIKGVTTEVDAKYKLLFIPRTSSRPRRGGENGSV